MSTQVKTEAGADATKAVDPTPSSNGVAASNSIKTEENAVKMEGSDSDSSEDDAPLLQVTKSNTTNSKQTPQPKTKVKKESGDDSEEEAEVDFTSHLRKSTVKKEPAVVASDSSDDDDAPLVPTSKPKPKPVVKRRKVSTAKKPPVKKQKRPAKKVTKRKRESSSDDDDDDSSSGSSGSSDSSSSSSDDSSDSEDDKPRRRSTKKRKASGSTSTEVHDPRKYEEAKEIAPLLPTKGANKWWNRIEELKKQQTRWELLQHNGVIFDEPYEPHGVRMLYDGKEVDLTPEQEEVANFYAIMIKTDYVKKKTFNDNFFADFRKVLGKGHVIKQLSKCDFRPIYKHLMAEREIKKERNKDPVVKKANAAEKERLSRIYGYAIVDGFLEKVNNPRVEPPSLFRGRGEHPKAGKVKPRILPEDVTINISKGVPIPKCPIPGHRWKGIVHNKNTTWLAFWKDKINGSFKYMFLAADSRFKGLADIGKYEKARKLKKYIGKVRDDYRRKLKSKKLVDRQLATATYLIDKLALRVGNEKDTNEEADTVGCCSLRVEHLSFAPPNQVTFDFLGKDSIRYENTVTVEEVIFDNLKSLCSGKPGNREIFDKITTSDLNNYLREFMDGLTAKVFRTYNASITLQEELDKVNIEPDELDSEKVVIYNRANREVAILCNHQRSIPKGHAGSMEKLELRLQKAQEKVENLEDHLAELLGKKPKKRKKKKAKKDEEETKKPRYSKDPDKIKGQLQRAKISLQNIEARKQTKEDTKAVSLTTAKINYMDPRITVAWCKRTETPIEKVFAKSLVKKFPWAMETESTWKF